MSNYIFKEKLASGVGTELSLCYKNSEKGELVVVKELVDSKYISSFESEIEALTSIWPHDNIINLIDSFVFKNKAFSVYDYYFSGDLYKIIRKNGAFSERDAVSVLSQIALALQHARKFGFFHCDIKPENILLKNNHYVLADWDLSCATDDLKSSMHYGSTLSMAPEVMLGRIHEKSDVYSLGCLLYFCLSGSRVFGLNVDSLPHTRVLSHFENVLDLSDIKCSSGLKKLLVNMLIKNPFERVSLDDVLLYLKSDFVFPDKKIEKISYEIIPEIVGSYYSERSKKKSWSRIDKNKKNNNEYSRSLVLAHLVVLSYLGDREAQNELISAYKNNSLMKSQPDQSELWMSRIK